MQAARSQSLSVALIGLVLLVFTASLHAADASPDLAAFVKAKEKQAHKLAEELEINVSSDVWAFFRTAQAGKFSAITNAFERLKKRSSQYEGSKDDPTVGSPVWQQVIEVYLAMEGLGNGDARYSQAFGNSVITSIPPGSIYFGGTDPGRGLITAMCRSHADADPFYTITQNALADARYLDYIRAMYGPRIHTPSADESQKAFQEYLQDAQKRLAHDREFPNEVRQIKPGEDVKIINNRVQVSGQVAVMAINGLLVKCIFDTNTNKEFFIEESFPLDWMYPYLTPHGYILKLNREPLSELPTETVKKDREFWSRDVGKLLGDWLTPETPVKDVCDFARKVFARKDFANFKGDRGFVTNDYAVKMYSKLRSSIGGVYHWRAKNPKSPAEKKLMTAEADYAFRQAFALCPDSPEAVFRYVDLLLTEKRQDDALRIAITAKAIEGSNATSDTDARSQQLDDLIANIRKLKPGEGK